MFALGRCQEQQWLDFKESQPWKVLKWQLLKTVMAMANLRDGGIIIIGVSERGDTWSLDGISPDDLATYDYDGVVDQITKYASPEVGVDIVVHQQDDEISYLVINVHQFTENPVVCRRNSPDSVPPKDRLAAGDFFIRPPGKPRTERVADAVGIHDLLELAAESRARRMLEVGKRVGFAPGDTTKERFDAELKSITTFPVPVTETAYWRVVIRPARYEHELIPSRSECRRLVEKATVQLRGWRFPTISPEPKEYAQGADWISSWCDFMGSVEFWRFYQSGQFIHYAAVQEVTQAQWQEQCQSRAMSCYRLGPSFDWTSVPGFISVTNLLYITSEVFEFAARLAQASLYEGDVSIRMELNHVADFVLSASVQGMWRHHCQSKEDILCKTWVVPSDCLIADSARHSLDAAIWFFEGFNWLEPNRELLARDQQEFLRR